MITTTTPNPNLQRRCDTLQQALVCGESGIQVAHRGRQLLLHAPLDDYPARTLAYLAQASPPWLPAAMRLGFAEQAIEQARAGDRWARRFAGPLSWEEAARLLTESMLVRADILRRKGDLAEARRQVNEAAAVEPRTMHHRRLYARLFLARGRIELTPAVAEPPSGSVALAASCFEAAMEEIGIVGLSEERPCEDTNLRGVVLAHYSVTQYMMACRQQADTAMWQLRQLSPVNHPGLLRAGEALQSLLLANNSLEDPVSEVPEVAAPFIRYLLRT